MPFYLPPNKTVNKVNEPVNDTVYVYVSVFSLIKKDKKITATQMSEHLQVSLSTVKRKIKQLKIKGIIERVGSDKTGYWKVVE